MFNNVVTRIDNARERTFVRSNAAFLGLCFPTSMPPPPYVSHISLSKISPTFSPTACFTVPCSRPSAPLRICRRSHLPARAPPCAVRFLLLPIARAHPCLSLLAPKIPLATCPPTLLVPAPSSAPSESAGAHGAVARLRSVPGQAKGTHEHGPCWPEAGINRP
jgi:hypothetical protein